MDNENIIKPFYFINSDYETIGDPTVYRSNVFEFWKLVTDNEVPGIVANRYYVSSNGRVYDAKINKLINSVCSAGNKYYEQFTVRLTDGSPKTIKVHRIVMMFFVPIENPQSYQVNHINGVHNKNDLYNLEWCTGKYNRYHSVMNGLQNNVYNKKIAIFYPFEIHQIKILRDQGLTYNEIIETMNLKERGADRKTIERIVNGKSGLYSQYYY